MLCNVVSFVFLLSHLHVSLINLNKRTEKKKSAGEWFLSLRSWNRAHIDKPGKDKSWKRRVHIKRSISYSFLSCDAWEKKLRLHKSDLPCHVCPSLVITHLLSSALCFTHLSLWDTASSHLKLHVTSFTIPQP